MFEHAPIGMALTDPGGSLVRVNRSLARLTGRAPEDLIDQRYRSIVHPDDVARIDRALDEVRRTGRVVATDHRVVRDEQVVWLSVHISAVWNDGKPVSAVIQAEDVTARISAERRLRHLVLHDPLTGLANRTLFLDRLDQALGRAASNRRVAVLSLGLDRFTAVNDAFGRSAGDEALAAVARRLSGVVRPGDSVARIAGDEFAVLCQDVGDVKVVVGVAERAVGAIREPLRLRGRRTDLAASVGVVVAEAAATADDVVTHAELAMRQAKHDRAGVVVFAPELKARAARRAEVERELRPAFADGDLELWFQPFFDREGSARGVESLLRWRHPHRGLLAPADFLDVAEDTGLIVDIDDWFLDDAVHRFAPWHRVAPDLALHVNVSVGRLSVPGLADRVARVLDAAEVPAGALCLELTETDFLRLPGGAAHQFEEVRDLGVRTALDDFGTGYSSLAHLTRFRIDALKIDGSFVRAMGHQREADAIVRAVVGLARDLGLTTVAEGAESPEQVARAFEIGVDRVQGFALSGPLPAGEVARQLLAAPAT
ncbi:MAG: EAL domain-containing protein [Actinobacteria bacterium]|nr:EAL domain-containing protein [Actinomycetota bacterium]